MKTLQRRKLKNPNDFTPKIAKGTTVQWPVAVGDLKLYEADNNVAFYYRADAFGNGHALEVGVRKALVDPDENIIIEVQRLTGNAWGQYKGKGRTPFKPYTLNWMRICSHYWPSLDRLFASWRGETEVPPRCRKPRPLEPMTDRQIETFQNKVKTLMLERGIPFPEAS